MFFREKRPNDDLREYCWSRGVYLWEVAELMKVRPTELSIQMRKEFDDREKKLFMDSVDAIADDKKNGEN